MKTNKLFLSAGLLAMTLTGCTDLDVDVKSQYTKYPEGPIAVEAKVADVYFQMAGPFGRRYLELMECASDEATGLVYGGGWYDGGFTINPSYHDSRPADATVDWMGELTSGCTKVNKIIKDLVEQSGISEDDPTLANARFMRVYFTYILADLWGDAPILTKVLQDGETVDRKPRKEVAQWMEKELLAIYPQMTEEVNQNTYGKPTKWVALGLLARLYTNWAVFTCDNIETFNAATAKNEKLADLVSVCEQIIASGKFDLGSVPYNKKFSYDNGPEIKDFIYAMPYDNLNLQGMQHGRAWSWKNMGKRSEKTYYGDVINNSFGGYMTFTPEFSSLFCLEGDVRNTLVLGLGDGKVNIYNAESVTPTAQPFLYNNEQVVLSKEISVIDYLKVDVGDDLNGYCQGCRPIKFFVKRQDFENGRNQSNDFPLIRYADVLLMKAEALVRQGKAAEAMDPFNQIRAYAQAPLLETEPTLEDIYQERGREFFCECLRRDDMIRFGHFEDEYFPHYKATSNYPNAEKYAEYAKFETSKRIFPLPNSILDTNPNWKQNPGY